MAIRPSQVYPGRIAAASDYPFGKPRNVSVSGDGTGTPLEAAWLSDLFGFQQALLTNAAVSPSDVPDTATVSQYLEALRKLFNGYASLSVSGSGLNTNDKCTLALVEQFGGYTVVSNEVRVPATGAYQVTWSASARVTTAGGANVALNARTATGSGGVGEARGSASVPADDLFVQLAAVALVRITNITTQGIAIYCAASPGDVMALSTGANLMIRRLA